MKIGGGSDATFGRQTLLYTLLDAVGDAGSGIIILGLTSRLTIMEMFEKRLRSRSSQVQIVFGKTALPELVRVSLRTSDPATMLDAERSFSIATSAKRCSLLLSLRSSSSRNYRFALTLVHFAAADYPRSSIRSSLRSALRRSLARPPRLDEIPLDDFQSFRFRPRRRLD